MDDTSFSGFDTALPAEEGSPSPHTAVADAAAQAASTASPLSDNWLNRAMALWLRDADGRASDLGQLSPH